MSILESDDDSSDIVSWMENGKGFTIFDKKRFANEVLPRYFKDVQFTSFTRKMRRWGFAMERVGRNGGTYHHPLFLRGDIQSVMKMRPKNRDSELPVALVQQPMINARQGIAMATAGNGMMFSMNEPLNPPIMPPLAPAVQHQHGHQQSMQQQGSSTSSSSVLNTASADQQSNPVGMVSNQGSQSNNLLEQLQQAQGTYFASLQQIYAQHQALLVMDRNITSSLPGHVGQQVLSTMMQQQGQGPQFVASQPAPFTQTLQHQSGMTPQTIQQRQMMQQSSQVPMQALLDLMSQSSTNSSGFSQNPGTNPLGQSNRMQGQGAPHSYSNQSGSNMLSQEENISSSSGGTASSRMPETSRSSGGTTSTGGMISTTPSSTMLQRQHQSTSSGSSNSRRESDDYNKYTNSARPNK